MQTNSKTATKSKLVGAIVTLTGVTGLIYAAMCQFTDGMDKNAAAGILLVSILVTFIGVSQLYKKQPSEY